MTSSEKVQRIIETADEIKAERIETLDVREKTSVADYFVVCTGQNTRQTAAIYNEVHSGMKHDVHLLPSSVDGQSEASWIVADYLDVVLHIFTPESRAYYRLEDLWGDAPPVEVAAG